LDNQLIITENKAISDIPERSRTKYKNSRRPLIQKDRLLVHLAIHSRAINKDVVTHQSSSHPKTSLIIDQTRRAVGCWKMR
jgi:hypothetical protein